MPDLVGLPLHGYTGGLATTALVDQTQLHPSRVFGKQREIYTFTIPAGTERTGLPWPDGD